MCGILGMIGKKKFSSFDIISRLKRLEYRGYDSFGYATPSIIEKYAGKIDDSMHKIVHSETRAAISHCRWATHGQVSQKNAHPHSSEDNSIKIVHNGIIENFAELKSFLLGKGHTFTSDTDSEVIAHYFEEKLRSMPMADAARLFFNHVNGQYAVLMLRDGEEKIYALKKDSPLCMGICPGLLVIASDIHAFSDITGTAVFFDDMEFAEFSVKGYRFFDSSMNPVKKEKEVFSWNHQKPALDSYPHFMIKEVHEQPVAAGRIIRSAETLQKKVFKEAAGLVRLADKTVFLGIGTAAYAGLFGEKIFSCAGIESISQNAADLNEMFVTPHSVVVVVSQSGETMDVISAMKTIMSKNPSVKFISILNVPHSTIHRMSDIVIDCCAGPEICVATTKAFTNQSIALLFLARELGLDICMEELPEYFRKTINANEGMVKALAAVIKTRKNLFILGHKNLYPIALESALKLKEITYLHAEGFYSGLLKHGPLALVEHGFPVINFLFNNNPHVISHMKEVMARGAFTIIVSNKSLPCSFCPDRHFKIPVNDEFVFGLCSNIITQLLSYHTALELGLPVDKPRNLAKSVTVL